MDNDERTRHLESAISDAVANQTDLERADRARAMRPARRRGRALLILLLLSWAAIAWIWIAKPGFVFGPDGESVSPQRREASLRFGMVLEQARASEHRKQTGRWPGSLAELGGEGEDGVTGAPEGSGFVVSGEAGTLRLELTDRMAVDSFLGRSLEILRRRQ